MRSKTDLLMSLRTSEIAVWRSSFGYRWAGPAIAIGVIVDIVGGTVGLPDRLISVVSDAVFVTALAAVGLKVLLTSDSDWEVGPSAVRAEGAAVAA